jgi:transcriptional regulator of arginine metabolism
VTQSSISRDLKALRVVKVRGRYVTSSSLTPQSAIESLPGRIRRVAAAGPYLLVVNTPPGQASAIAVAIDRHDWPEIVGTVAGDDTLLIATRGRSDQCVVEARLASLA